MINKKLRSIFNQSKVKKVHFNERDKQNSNNQEIENIPKELRFDRPGSALLKRSGLKQRRAYHVPGTFKE